jgi:transposase
LANPISNDKREAIIKHKEAGESESDICKWLFIHPRTVQRVWKKYKETGSYKPKAIDSVSHSDIEGWVTHCGYRL